MSDIEQILYEQTWKHKKIHQRSQSHDQSNTQEKAILNPVKRTRRRRQASEIKTEIATKASSPVNKLAKLAVPYKELFRVLRSLSTQTQEFSYFKVPLIKKFPFGKHSYNGLQPRFKNIFIHLNSKQMIEKQIIEAKRQSGRLSS